jgi:prolyl 4-hydroxylase
MADGIQILRYKPKQAYIGHHDYFPTGQSDDFNWDPKAGGSNRFATVLLYLSDVSEGGGTVFTLKPNATAMDANKDKSLDELVGGSDAEKMFGKNSQDWEKDLVKTCFTNFRLLPKKGDAILFYVRQA